MLGFDIKHFASINSTNTYSLENIRVLSHNTVIVADTQTNGKGRHGRVWTSDSSENLYISFVIKPDIPFNRLPIVNFPQFFSVVTADAFAYYGAAPQIKWPNDVLLNGKKCAGILCETSFDGDAFNGLVAGIGINIGHDPTENLIIKQPASSLSSELGRRVEKNDFFSKMLELYSSALNPFCLGGFLSIKESYMKYFLHIGKRITLTSGGRNIEGIVRGVSDSGDIVLKTDLGGIENIMIGEVLWET